MMPLKTGHLSNKKALDVEQRDLKIHCEQLRKELERKDARNDKLSKELVTVRTTLTNYERDFKIATGSLERVNADRLRLQNEIKSQKDYVSRLESQLTKFNDAEGMIKVIKEHQQNMELLQHQINQLEELMNVKDDKIRSLEYELDVMKRSIEVQVQYESGLRGGNNGREMMRSLYNELAKRQTDLQKLATTLSEFESSNSSLKRELEASRHECQERRAEISDLRRTNESLKLQMSQSNDEMSLLRSDANANKELIQNLYDKNEEISRQSALQSSRYQNTIDENRKTISDLTINLSQIQKENLNLKRKIDGMQQTLDHIDSSKSLSVQKYEAQYEKLAVEYAILQQELQNVRNNPTDKELMRKAIEKERSEKEEAIRQLRMFQSQLSQISQSNILSRIADMESLLTVKDKTISTLTQEKTDISNALQQVMSSTRDLTERFALERQEKEALEARLFESEKSIEGLRKAKEHISTAVLDALHKERLKVMTLEKALQELPPERRFAHMTPSTTKREESHPMSFGSPLDSNIAGISISNSNSYFNSSAGSTLSAATTASTISKPITSNNPITSNSISNSITKNIPGIDVPLSTRHNWQDIGTPVESHDNIGSTNHCEHSLKLTPIEAIENLRRHEELETESRSELDELIQEHSHTSNDNNIDNENEIVNDNNENYDRNDEYLKDQQPVKSAWSNHHDDSHDTKDNENESNVTTKSNDQQQHGINHDAMESRNCINPIRENVMETSNVDEDSDEISYVDVSNSDDDEASNIDIREFYNEEPEPEPEPEESNLNRSKENIDLARKAVGSTMSKLVSNFGLKNHDDTMENYTLEGLAKQNESETADVKGGENTQVRFLDDLKKLKEILAKMDQPRTQPEKTDNAGDIFSPNASFVGDFSANNTMMDSKIV